MEGEPPRVYPLGERIVVEGPVDDLDTLEQVALVSRIYDEDFVNLMSVRGDHQVQLEVMFAEVSRTASRELGLNVLYGSPVGAFGLVGPTTGAVQFAVPSLLNSVVSSAADGFVGSPVVGGMSLGAFVQSINLAAVIGTLDDYKVAKNPGPAHAGVALRSEGRVPLRRPGADPDPQGGGGGSTVTITYKDYGVELWFIPTVLAGDVIDVQMYVEISDPTFFRSQPGSPASTCRASSPARARTTCGSRTG